MFNNLKNTNNDVELDFSDSGFVGLPKLAFHKRFVFIGETGLDNSETGRKMDMVYLKKWPMVKGILAGMMSASIGSYAVVEKGLHLYRSFEELEESEYEESVGYVSSTYDGEHLGQLKHVLPEFGWREIGYAGDGVWIGGKICIPSDYDATNDGDNVVNEKSNKFWKHKGLDVLISALKSQRPLKLEYFVDEYHQKKMDWFESLANMNIEDRKVALAENNASAIVRKEERKVTKFLEKGFVPSTTMATIRLFDGGEVTVEDLLGKKFTLRMGSVRVPGAFDVFDAQNATKYAEVIRRRNLTVELC